MTYNILFTIEQLEQLADAIRFCSTTQWAGLLSRYSDWLRAGRSGDRISVGERFFTRVQTGLGAHPASCTMGTGPFQGVNRLGRGADHPPPS
jgi:hypothetical protein